MPRLDDPEASGAHPMSETRLDKAAREAATAVLEHECIESLFDGTEAQRHAEVVIRAALEKQVREAAADALCVRGGKILGPLTASQWLLSWAGLEERGEVSGG
jgi:hypothetical protein